MQLMTTTDEIHKPMNSFYWEESNAQLSGALPDLKAFKKHCATLCEKLNLIWEHKKSGEKSNSTDFIMHLIAIKELNRQAQFRIRKARDNTLEQKLVLDKSHLNLQNLLYEVAHLENEITTCLEFKSQHEMINLIPVEEFYKVTQKVPRSLGTHEETLERLYWELEQRKSLSVACDELRKAVDSVNDEIIKKRDYLASFSPKLKELSESTLAVQELMNLPFTKEEDQYSVAFLLPAPLYVLYSRMKSYITMTGRKSVTVEIVGDAQLAKAVNSMPPTTSGGTSTDTTTTLSSRDAFAAGVMETESDGEETEELKKRKQSRHKNKPASTNGNNTSHKMLTSLHPLSVVLAITHTNSSTTSKEYNVQLTVSFSWLPSVGLTTVRILFETLSDGAPTPISQSASDLLHSEHLLANLYWSTDTESNQKASSSDLPLLTSTSNNQSLNAYQWNACSPIGRPYAWAQALCGSHYFPESPPAKEAGTPPDSDSQPHPFGLLEAWLQAVERRLADRLALVEELEAIETGCPRLSAEQQALLPPTAAGVNGAPISNWRRATFEQLQAVARAQVPISLGLVQSADAVFRCQFRLSTQTATVWVTVPAEYPRTAALLVVDGLLTPSSGQESNLDLSDLHLQELETEVNCYWSEFTSHRLSAGRQSLADGRQVEVARAPQQNILSCQLARCAACLETLCHHSQQSPSITPRGIKYPTRSRPLRYLPVTRTFAHR